MSETAHLPLVKATCKRILRQLRHDPHTIAMAVVVPSALVLLVRFVLNSEERFNTSAPPLIAIFPFSVMFLVTSIVTLRERLTGTLERLMTYSVARIDLLLGYVAAFVLVAAAQVLLVVTISAAWLGLTIEGSAVVLFVVAMLNAVLGIAFGLLGSAVTRTEYQVVQLLPVFVLPQVLICGLFAPRDTMAPVLDALAGVLPLPGAVEAIDYVADSGSDAGIIAKDVLFLAGYTVVTLAVGAATLQRRTGDREPVLRRLFARTRGSRSEPRGGGSEVVSPGRPAGDEASVSWFELYQDSGGQYRFRLRNGHGVLAGSGAFDTRSEAEDAIRALCEGVPSGGLDMQANGAVRQ